MVQVIRVRNTHILKVWHDANVNKIKELLTNQDKIMSCRQLIQPPTQSKNQLPRILWDYLGYSTRMSTCHTEAFKSKVQ